MNRRHFLQLLAGTPLAACTPQRAPSIPPGDWLGQEPATGHRLRDGLLPTRNGPAIRTGVLVVGAGVGGLSAGWWLARRGEDDFLIAEMQNAPGGNTRAGRNAASAFPLGAHYLPLPTQECHTLRRLLADLGVLHGDPDALRPRYEERLLCAAPQERLFRNGHWQDGIAPDSGLSAREHAQMRRFFERIATLRTPRDGQKPFALPMAGSRLDPEFLALDRMSFRDWLLAEGLDAAPLHWYTDYACRDDYGTPAARTSAWAGIHYFACRDGQAEGAANDIMLTAPEGNAWLTQGLASRLGERVRCNASIRHLVRTREGWDASLVDEATQTVQHVLAKAVVWAAPLFVAARVIEGLPDHALAHARTIEYAPWVLAHLTLARDPTEQRGAPQAWDNVIYDSPALGYIVNTHQSFQVRPTPTVWSWYCALSGIDTAAQRRQLLQAPREHWAAVALTDLGKAHPDLGACVERIDCVRYGHAMARPLPGFLTASGRQWFADGITGLQFAHADVSGFSICEEAHSRGVAAAERIFAQLHARKPDATVTL